jgi:hypothetical protein
VVKAAKTGSEDAKFDTLSKFKLNLPMRSLGGKSLQNKEISMTSTQLGLGRDLKGLPNLRTQLKLQLWARWCLISTPSPTMLLPFLKLSPHPNYN